MGRKPLDWIKVDTKGKSPIPRYFHSMNFYERGNYVIIHGWNISLLAFSLLKIMEI